MNGTPRSEAISREPLGHAQWRGLRFRSRKDPRSETAERLAERILPIAKVCEGWLKLRAIPHR